MMIAIAAVVLALVGVGAYFAIGGGGSDTDGVAVVLAGTQADLAKRRLEAGEYRSALQSAERALQVVPGHAEAQAVRDEAQAIVDQVDAAAQALATARGDVDAAAAATALWDLMQADAEHEAAASLEPAGEGAFESRVEEARSAMNEAKRAASRGSYLPVSKEAESLAERAETEVEAGRFGSAVRHLLQSRSRFQRAQRSAR
jgi:hypothetical protein